MKKIILTTAIILTALVGAFAQDDVATANLSVTINRIQTINVNNANVNLNYSSTEHYKNGVTEVRPDHLTVYSTGAFQVTVKAADLTSAGSETIAASGISVTAANGTTKPLANLASSGAVHLQTDKASTIFTSTQGGVDRNVDVTYKGAGGDDYINKYFKNIAGTANVYKTTVTYSIEAM